MKGTDMEICINIVTSGRHNPSLSIKLDSEAAVAFVKGFFCVFGSLEKTIEGSVRAVGRTYQQKTVQLMSDLRTFIQNNGNRKELWDFYNVLSELDEGEFFAISSKQLSEAEYNEIKENVLQLNVPDYEGFRRYRTEVCGILIDNYRMVFYEQERKQLRIGETDKAKRKCRFCRESMPTVKFDKDAHTISEGLGNKSIITNDECDTCNETLGKEIEQDLMTYLSPLRTFSSIAGKHGRTKIKDDSFAIYEESPGKIRIDLFDQEIPELKHWTFKEDGENFTLSFTHPQKLNPQDVYRAIVKYAIGVMEEVELPYFQDTIDWVNKENTAVDLPKLCFFLDNNPKDDKKPCITVFFRKNSDKTLPYSFIDLKVAGVVVFAVIPFCNQDDRTFSKEEDWKHILEVVKIFEGMPLLKVIIPNEDEEIRMTYNFKIKKHISGD